MRRLSIVLWAAAAAVLPSCGKPGAPRPPEPRGPLPPTQVVARQIGTEVEVTFTVPDPRGQRPSQEPSAAELVRVAFAPGSPAPEDAHAFRLKGLVVGRVDGDPLVSSERRTMRDDSLASLSEGGTGWTLRYGVRVRDRRGRPSALVVARDLLLVPPPPPPRDLAAEATADGIRLSWRGDLGGAVSGFNVYRSLVGEPPPERPLNGTPLPQSGFLDDSVAVGAAYRYFVRAAVGDGEPFRESLASADVALVAEDRFAPATPTGLVVVQEGRAVRLFWDPNAERDLGGYRVLRSPASDGPEVPLTEVPVREATYLDRDVEPGRRYAYRVAAVDRGSPPNESEPSEPEQIDVTEDPAAPREDPR